MPSRTTYAVQVFTWQDGRLARGKRILAMSAYEAINTAAALVPTVPFSAALRLTADEEGDAWTITMIGSFGETPKDFAASMLDG